MRLLEALVYCCAIQACSDDRGDAIRRFDTADVLLHEDELPSQKAEWMRSTTHLTGPDANIESFSTSGGLAVMLQRDPKMLWKFVLADSGTINGGPVLMHSTGYQPALGVPTDILGVTPDGRAIVLDPTSGRILSDDIGGRHLLLSEFRFKSSVRKGCALQEHELALLDDLRPGIVTIQTTSVPQRSHTVRIPAWRAVEGDHTWKDAQLSGAIGRPCVLWHPNVATAFLLTDSSVTPLDFHDRNADVASCPLGPATLPRGRMHGAQVVRFFDATGVPIGAMRIDRAVRKIGCTPHRLIVMARKKDSLFVGSFVLPGHLRTTPVMAEPMVMAPVDPNSSRHEPPSE